MGTTNEPQDALREPPQEPALPAQNQLTQSLDFGAFDHRGRSTDPKVNHLVDSVCDLMGEVHDELVTYVEARPPYRPVPGCYRTTHQSMMETVQFLVECRHNIYEKLMPQVSALNLPRWMRELAELGGAIVVFEDAFANSKIQQLGPQSPGQFRLPEELRCLLQVVLEKADPPTWPKF